jgi:hypothetical protein
MKKLPKYIKTFPIKDILKATKSLKYGKLPKESFEPLKPKLA